MQAFMCKKHHEEFAVRKDCKYIKRRLGIWQILPLKMAQCYWCAQTKDLSPKECCDHSVKV